MAETCSYFLLLNTITNPHYPSCSLTDIYLTISLSTHNGDDTPQNLGLLKVIPGGIYSYHWALEGCSSTLGSDDGDYNYYLTKKNTQRSDLLAKRENLAFSKVQSYLILRAINFDSTQC